MLKKIIGLFLLILGVFLILWGVGDSYRIFTAKKAAPELFKLSEVGKKEAVSQTSREMRPEEIIKEQLETILPAEFSIKIFNLTAWSIFMAILVLAAAKLALIGTKLL